MDFEVSIMNWCEMVYFESIYYMQICLYTKVVVEVLVVDVVVTEVDVVATEVDVVADLEVDGECRIFFRLLQGMHHMLKC